MADQSDRLLDASPTSSNPKVKISQGGIRWELALIAFLMVALLAMGAALFYMATKPPELPAISSPPPVPQPTTSQRAPERPAQIPAVQPPQPEFGDADLAPVAAPRELDRSDNQVREAARDLSPSLLAWLTPDEQMRKWVLLVVNLANGEVPSKHLPIKYSMLPFDVTERNGKLYAKPFNYMRLQPLVDRAIEVSPEKAAAYYRRWQPMFEKAYDELGLEGNFHGHLLKAIDNVLAAKPLPRNASLKQPEVNYLYEDPNLESATELSRLLWRMGPANTEKLQEFLLALKRAL